MKRALIMGMAILIAVSLLAQFKIDLKRNLDNLRKGQEALETAKKISNAVRPFTEEEEYYIGRAVAAQLLGRYRLQKNVPLSQYLSSVGLVLALHSDRPEIYNGYHFAVLDTDELNAFATPGGIVFLTRGIVRACKNEDELASVIAHEIGHVVAKHPLKAIQMSRLTDLFGLGAEELTKASPMVVDLVKGSVTDITSTLVENGYSKTQEREADLAALDLLEAAGYAPAALRDVLSKLNRDAKSEGIVEATLKVAFSSHPPAKDRLKYVEKSLRSRKAIMVQDERISRFEALRKLAGL